MFNQATIVARLGKDPELRYTQSSVAVCSFSAVTSESFTKDGEKRENNQWHNIVAWDKLGENCSKYLKKGSLVFVQGKIEYRQYTNKEGHKVNQTEIIAQTVRFLSPSGKKEEGAEPKSAPVTPQVADEMGWDDIPF